MGQMTSFSDSARTERLIGPTAGVARDSRWSISWRAAPVLVVDEWPRSAAFATRRQELLPRFLTRLREQPIGLSTTFDRPRLHAVRAVAHVVAGDDLELHHGQFPQRRMPEASLSRSHEAAIACTAPVKPICRGSLPCSRAAWAMVLRVRL